jgi:colanic acid/amylovoran biosynthesis glycosyltransferase
MKVAYIVSMFPCWSETFILNELIDHEKNGVDLSIFSIKKCNDKLVQDKAVHFIGRTTYISRKFWIEIWFFHLFLLISCPLIYLSLLSKLLFSQTKNYKIKFKCFVVFFIAPYFCLTARKQNITHLHAHFATYPALLAWIISRFNGIPFSVTAHAHDIYTNQDILRIFSDDAMTIVAISKFNKNFIIDKLSWKSTEQVDKIKVIHCGIDLTAYEFDAARSESSRANRKFRILSVGRFTAIKGFNYLLDALSLLRQSGYDFSCEIIGDGPLKNELTKQCESLNLGDCVTFLGAKKSHEVLECMKMADLFVLACAECKHEGHDGIPVVFMETMALGVPVIATRISGIPELVIHGKTGLCALPENPVSLKDNILYSLDNHDQSLEMVNNARRIIEQEFDIEKSSNLLRKIFFNESEKPMEPS